jgi:thiol-disulfide isomerase/thioredoxin/mono/diheme cytochrome c family protein
VRRALVTALVIACAAFLLADAPAEQAAARPRLKTIYSSEQTLEDFDAGDVRAVVLVFLGTECPVARQYVPTLKQLADEYCPQQVSFVGVFSDAGVNVFKMATYAHDEDLSFPVVQDVEHRLADMLGVSSTPEVVVLDKQREKRYQGAIDDQFQRHGRKAQATKHYLADALRSVLDNKPVERSFVPASGCPLERGAPQRTARSVTYYKDIAPLVQKNCQECHRQGGPGPFELTSFDDVAYNAEKIREVVVDRRMPPWHGILNPEFGKLSNSKQLAEEEIATILAWVDAGTPEGNRADAPSPVRWPAASQWGIGQPDFVYRMPEPFRVPKSGALEYQFFRVPLNLPQDRWFRGVEIKPGTPEVVHHVTLHVAPATSGATRFDGLAVMAQLYGLNGELAHVISDFVPGDTYNAKVFPSDQAVLIPKHSDLIFEVHYTPNNRQQVTDQSMVAFLWASAPPKHQVRSKIFRRPVGEFRVPPHDPHYRVEDTYYFEHDVLIDSIRPHFHLRGKSYRLEIIERDPKTDEIQNRRTILTVPIYDPAWQRTYELATPLRVEAGTELLATGHFDNSSLNPNNPNPSVEVLWGQQMTDEMFSTRFKYRLVDETAK